MAVRARALAVLATVGSLALGAAACGGAGGGEGAGGEASASTTTPSPTSAPIERAATVARALGPTVAVFADPDTTEPTQDFPGTSAFGFRQSFLVVDEAAGALEVLLPARPNGSTGWVRHADVELQQVGYEIEVDLTAHTLRLRDGDEVVVETPAAIGAPDAPTPTGRFFVTDLLETGEPGHDYGPFAAGLSGFSTKYSEFAGGNGQIGIHGTNDPASIGQAVSHGCVRVPNDVITLLATTVPIGTPVTIG